MSTRKRLAAVLALAVIPLGTIMLTATTAHASGAWYRCDSEGTLWESIEPESEATPVPGNTVDVANGTIWCDGSTIVVNLIN